MLERILLKPELILELMRLDGSNLQHIPPQFRTADICAAALSSHLPSFTEVPLGLQPYEMVDAAIEKDFAVVETLGIDDITQELLQQVNDKSRALLVAHSLRLSAQQSLGRHATALRHAKEAGEFETGMQSFEVHHPPGKRPG